MPRRRRLRRPPGAAPAVHPWCDAIEISDLLLRRVPTGHTRDGLVTRLRHNPDVTGPDNYHVLCIGYALNLLGSGFEHPSDISMDLDALPWARNAWSAGATVDVLGTAIAWNIKNHGDSTGAARTPSSAYPFRTPTRLPVPSWPTPRIPGSRTTPCNVLDVIHPLWLARKQTSTGRTEAARWVEPMLARVLDHWADGQGFAVGEGDEPGLQGTEMWLAIVWLLADYLGMSDALGYRPRGVHRPEPLIG